MQELGILSETLGRALQAKGWQLSLAESCTGGMVSQAITSVAGSSGWFDRGFVTYSNAAKTDMLGVPDQLILAHGAVSEPVAQSMASGAIERSLANISGAVTGIAGPGGGSLQKPVGTVCFSWAVRENTGKPAKLIAETKYFDGDRSAIRQQAASYLLTGLLRMVKQTDSD